jgi:hypothetical protein
MERCSVLRALDQIADRVGKDPRHGAIIWRLKSRAAEIPAAIGPKRAREAEGEVSRKMKRTYFPPTSSTGSVGSCDRKPSSSVRSLAAIGIDESCPCRTNHSATYRVSFG